MTTTPTDRPNVIVFFTDQQRWDCSSLHGNPLDLMPHFDRMAIRGTHLAHCFTPQPVCGPARACLQTGQYATTNGCFRNNIPLSPDCRTLAHHFRDGGYHTGYIGKWHLATGTGPVAAQERGGYEYWLGSNLLEFTSQSYDTTVYDNLDQPVNLPGYRVDALTDAAIRYVDQHQHQPFFLFLSHLEPHFQNHLDDYPPPDGYRQRYTGQWTPPDLAALGGSAHQHLGGYWGMVKRLDEALGRLLDALKSLKLHRRTIVLFTSDHGCHFRTRNGEYKRSCHDSSIRVPTALSGPMFDGGGHVDRMVSLIDLPPTLLDACGLPIPSIMQGRSILPLLHGRAADWPDEAFTQISESQVGRCVRTSRWKYSVSAPGLDGEKVSASDRYVEEFLYDMEADPYELTNLIAMQSHRNVADVMRQRLIHRMVAAGEAECLIDTAQPHPSGRRTVSAEETYA